MPRQTPPDECRLLPSQSDYTTASRCISDHCFLCAHVAPDHIETSRNLAVLQILQLRRRFEPLVGGSPCQGYILESAWHSVVCQQQRNMEQSFVASVDEGPRHLTSLPDHSEKRSVRPRVTYPRTGMLAT